VRTANAFLAREVVIVGRRRWNRRGAMVTDRYQHVRHVESVAELERWSREQAYELVGVDNVAGSAPLETAALAVRTVFLFGQEGPGLTPEGRHCSARTLSIAQWGSTRSINAGVAAGIAMHAWVRQHTQP
jgi:tRNA G18 (ribose-2'-O)-methylase SpoU